jgi:hypothetical protein
MSLANQEVFMRRLMLAFITVPLLCGPALAQTAPTPPAPMPPPGGPDAPPPPGGWMHHRHGDHWLAKKFGAANTTHDGHLTLAQAQAAGLKMVVDHFADIDMSKRGYVTINDIQAWRMDDMAKHLEQKASLLRAQDK